MASAIVTLYMQGHPKGQAGNSKAWLGSYLDLFKYPEGINEHFCVPGPQWEGGTAM